MSTSSSEEGSGTVGHSTTSSGLESTESLIFSVPSDLSDVQTEITPPSSPAPSEAKMRTPRDILDASRRLGQISALALQGDITPTKPKYLKQFHHRVAPESVANDEAGYDADGDGDESILRADGAGTTATTKPIRRPTFLRIDTRQHRRVASMLATRRPSPCFLDTPANDVDTPHPPRAKLSLFPLKSTAAAAKTESYELRRRRSRAEPGPELVGLGIGFPESHPLRNRAFSMPVSVISPSHADSGPGPGEEIQRQVHRRSEWFPSASGSTPAGMQYKKIPVGIDLDVCAPSPVRLALRPTFLDVSPSPIECLSGAFNRYDILGDHSTRSEVSGVQGDGNRRTMGALGCHAEPEIARVGYARAPPVAREGQLDLSASVVPGASLSEAAMTLDIGSRAASLSSLGT